MTPKPSRTSVCTPPADPGSAAVVAHASESSSGACIHHDLCECKSCVCTSEALEQASPKLPVEVPESDILWRLLSGGYSLNFVRNSLYSGHPVDVLEATAVRADVQELWAQIRAEAGA